MIVPAPRLLIVTACVVAPCLAVAVFAPPTAPAMLAVVAVAAMLAGFDAHRGRQRARGLELGVPESVRWTQSRPARLTATLANRDPQPQKLRLAAVFPSEIACSNALQEVSVPAGSASIHWQCIPERRGNFTLHAVEWEQSSPARLWEIRTAVRPNCELRVYPGLHDRRTRALLLRQPMEGLHLRRQVGKGREFERLREYAPGDAYDDIAWKATARRGHPIVAVTQVERTQQVYVAIDTSRLAAGAGALDAYVEASLHLSIACQRYGDQFGLLAFSDRVRRFVRAGAGARHFGALREALYTLGPSRVAPDFAEAFAFVQRMLRRRALIVFLTFLDDPALAEEFVRDAAVISGRHLVLVHVPASEQVRPAFAGPAPESEQALYERLAGQILFSNLRQTGRSLERLGARFRILDRALLLDQVVESYVEIKRRQLL
jgi:uncharacterized protein (DUF58 family)